LTEYSQKNATGKKPGLQPRCKTCAAEETREWRKTKSTEFLKDSYYKRTYGISLEEFNLMWDNQKGRCKICEVTLQTRSHSPDSVVVDHCHTTGKVRGLLCNECNRGLGYYHDNPIALRKAAEYLENI
jgi:NMD protein affecting ribosome stability and mRNA decay